MKKSKAILMAVSVGVVVCIITCLLTLVIYDKKISGGTNSLDLGQFSHLEEIIDKYYLYDYDIEDVQEAGMKAMVSSLEDPYSVYFTKEEFEAFNQSSAGEYEGIGMLITVDKDTGYAMVIKFFAGSSAEEKGVQIGDLIISVDGVDVKEKTLTEISTMCTGPEGTTVKIGVQRGQETLEFELERRAITVDMVTYELLDDDIGYMKIMQFGGNASPKFAEALNEFKKEGVKGVVIDLRDNPGGYLNIVVEMLDMVLPEGKIVYTEDKYGHQETEYSDESCVDLEFTILVNGNTASASEIFAGAMQDYDYCDVVGTTTYGKGVVQVVLPMEDAGVKITVSEYFTPNGRSINGNGIYPDEYIEVDSSVKDNQLDKAIEVLRQRID